MWHRKSFQLYQQNEDGSIYSKVIHLYSESDLKSNCFLEILSAKVADFHFCMNWVILPQTIHPKMLISAIVL